MNLKSMAIVAGITISSIVGGGAAQAVQLASGSSVVFGLGADITATPLGSLSSATSLTLGGGTKIIDSTSGDFSPSVPVNSSVFIAPLTLPTASGGVTEPAFSFSVFGNVAGTVPEKRFVFTANNLVTTSAAPNNINLEYAGIITDITGAFDPTPGKALASFGQVGGPGTGISGSVTLIAVRDRITTVPESQPLSMLGSLAIIGLGVFSTRKLGKK